MKKFVILGLDGMDPDLTEMYLDQGKLPHLARLQKQGCFKRLQTTVPSMSPVAWSSFQTGSNPGKHNIFDFLTRDKQTYAPVLSSVSIRPPRRSLKIGKYQLPLGKADIRLLRKGKPFWYYLGQHGIFSNIIRVPITFPPEKFRGVMLSGMCVPDLRGSQGMFSFYTTRSRGEGEYTGGEQVRVERRNGVLNADLIGPENPLHQDRQVLKCPFTINLNKGNGRYDAILKVNGETYPLKKGLYTDWVNVEFKAGLGLKIRGICQFLLVATEPEFALYVTPINLDPDKPVMPITHPAVYANYLARQHGPYATLGLAEDTWALNNKILSDETFLHQCLQGDAEREKMFCDALDKVKRGLVVCVFDGTDRVQHTFWRYVDDRHPAGDGRARPDHPIEQVYRRMDDLVGRTMLKCRHRDTMLMIISDHGFKTFRYGVDLNCWLMENGYLKMKEDGWTQKHLQGIDWSRTRAYAVGLAGIYLNIKGREARGIVDPDAEARQLRKELAEKLVQLHDPQRNQRVVKQVYNALKVYQGPYKTEAPDLLVGYEVGYRASWETAIGQVTEKIIHDNVKAWSGDHCIDRSLVPGVLFCNRPLDAEEPRLMDIGPTVLDMFGVEVPSHMDGRPLSVAQTGEDKLKTAGKPG
ncbi:MAG: nucleotide pyrophosphatase [Phycisphaerae bacterium SM23_30]|nr:MAG: nucleotide pyrophosphatase [Phycisphaerae bacterium SM23_30]